MTDLNEEKVLKIEAKEVLKEVAYAVKSANISEKLPSSDECVFMNILTQEEQKYCIELSVQGFQVTVFTPQPLRAVGVLFSPMVSEWAGVRGKSLSGLYLRNRKV